MSLRLQLLALGALTLLLPWAGVRLVQEFEASLRSGLESFLIESARARIVTTGLDGNDAVGRQSAAAAMLAPPLYAHSLIRDPLLDGFQGDWYYARDSSDTAAGTRAIAFDDGTRVWLGVGRNNLFLFIDVVDDEVVYQRVPGEEPHGDRVVLILGGDPGRRAILLLANSGAGTFRAQPTDGGPEFEASGGYFENVYGAWRDTPDGFAIEARVPLSLANGAIGIGIIDSFDGGRSARQRAATWNAAQEPNRLVRESPELNRILAPFAGGQDRIRIIDRDGWVIADSGPVGDGFSDQAEAGTSLIERVFRYLLRRDDPEHSTQENPPARISDPVLRRALDGEQATAWYRRGADVSAIVAAAVPIGSERGAVVLEQASDPILTATNQAMMRLIATTVLILLAVPGGLLAYASFLSFRVGRLARAAGSALGPRGEIDVRLPGVRGRDEIGDLSRAFTDLLGRLRDYTDYLQSLKSKLSHELRTPLAVVATSIDNLEHELGTAPGKEYLARLRQGADRLEAILQAMTAATRVEQAIAQSTPETFDLAAIVASCVFAYRDVYPRSFELSLPAGPVSVHGSPELVEQMLDKLVDNAAGFAEDGTTIEVGLETTGNEARLSVVNRGPLLPEAMKHQLFDSLVSVRQSEADKPHLGLGLHIVLLVAEFHQGHVEARNLADGSGVEILVALPCADAGSAKAAIT